MWEIQSESPLLALCNTPIDTHSIVNARFQNWPGVGEVAKELARVLSMSSNSIDEINALVRKVSRCHHSVMLRGGEGSTASKLDLCMNINWVRYMRKNSKGFRQAEKITAEALKILTRGAKKRTGERVPRMIKSWHLIVTFPGSERQPLHMDNGDDPHWYATVAFPLISPLHGGHTSFPRSFTGMLTEDEIDTWSDLMPVYCSTDKPVLFGGDTVHFGEANKSIETRIGLFAVLYSDYDVNSIS